MIANDRQHQQTRKKASELEQLLESLHARTAGDDGFRDLQIAGVESWLSDLDEELDEYEKLSGGTTTMIESSTLAGLADALIKARIARRWTQDDLAAALGVTEQPSEWPAVRQPSAADLSHT
jgi:hypothetical protein